MIRDVSSIVVKNPLHNFYSLRTACISHTQKHDTSMRLIGMVNQDAEVEILSNDNTLLPHGPLQNQGITHMWVNVSGKDGIVTNST
jgi:hypothetical protein